ARAPCPHGAGRGSRSGRVLAGPAATALRRDDDAVDEDLAAPDAPGLGAFDRAGEAALEERAGLAQRLGLLDLGLLLGEPELGVVHAARNEVADDPVELRALVGESVVRRAAGGDRGTAVAENVEQRGEPHDVLHVSVLVK